MWWPPFLYPLPGSAFVAAMMLVQLAVFTNMGLRELCGEHLAYSKFLQVVAGQQQKRDGGGVMLPSRQGMLVAYVPALVAAVALFAVPSAVEGVRAPSFSAPCSPSTS
ncbi:hypothetical protein E2562_022335 [Oryza meyeriana var. granulata]|uniref:Uncharacterized protein n=1 Tax=Oryza meyeriana var. granulata TaxID=110450 RepID=A0A6G1D6G4_9ORYZ|nr:hypothetical protein E2562_022335 [Oryza meyeriana var. granulata]